MTSIGSLSTSMSLIARAKQGDSAAWHALADLYGPIVYRWARRAGLQDSDAADIMQDVFRDVAQGIARFRKEKSSDTFRGWLWVITRNRLRRFFRTRHANPVVLGGSDANQLVQEWPDTLDGDEEPHESESTTDLVHRALDMIRGDFEDRTWQACWRMAIAGHTASEIGRDLNMTDKAVRQAKYRILCRLRQILSDDE